MNDDIFYVERVNTDELGERLRVLFAEMSRSTHEGVTVFDWDEESDGMKPFDPNLAENGFVYEEEEIIEKILNVIKDEHHPCKIFQFMSNEIAFFSGILKSWMISWGRDDEVRIEIMDMGLW